MFVEDTIMRINIDRLSKLAGLPVNNRSGRTLREGKEEMEAEGMRGMREEEMGAEGMREEEDEDGMREMADLAYMTEEDMEEMRDMDEMDMEEMRDMAEEEDMNEMIEVDEAMLVQELRRAKKIMQENKRRKIMAESRKRNRKQRMFEAQLREMIDQEVANVFDEMQITGEWVYGRNKPTRSRKGYTHQGSFIPGVGFKR
jgi:hypothetical protein